MSELFVCLLHEVIICMSEYIYIHVYICIKKNINSVFFMKYFACTARAPIRMRERERVHVCMCAYVRDEERECECVCAW